MHYTVCDLLLDVVQNSIEAEARNVRVSLEEKDNRLLVEVEDDGRGMDEETLRRARDPFYTEPGKHPERRVGLGIPFLIQTVEASGGNYEISSEPSRGTRLRFDLDLGNVDTPPMGDLPGTLRQMFCYDGSYEMEIVRRRGERGYEIKRSELIETLGELERVGVLGLLQEFLESQEAWINEEAEHGTNDPR
ncbi:MAG: ATP-binding protein [Alkalispirochaetaceae bacterium]